MARVGASPLPCLAQVGARWRKLAHVGASPLACLVACLPFCPSGGFTCRDFICTGHLYWSFVLGHVQALNVPCHATSPFCSDIDPKKKLLRSYDCHLVFPNNKRSAACGFFRLAVFFQACSSLGLVRVVYFFQRAIFFRSKTTNAISVV